MKNFDNRTRKIQCNHNFYMQTYFYLILVSDNESYLKQDLAFDGVVIFIHYKMINLDSNINKNNKGAMKNGHIFLIILTKF